MIYTNHQIKFNAADCIGCKLCYKACFVDVIRWDADHKKPLFMYVEDCEHCNYCEIACPRHCIEVVPDYQSEGLLQNFDCYR